MLFYIFLIDTTKNANSDLQKSEMPKVANLNSEEKRQKGYKMSRTKGRFFTTDKSFYKGILTIFLPLFLQGVTTFLLSAVDNVSVARLGENATAGVFVGTQIQLILQMLLVGIEGGVLIIGTQYHGKGDSDGAKRIAVCGVISALLLGTIISLSSLVFSEKIVSVFIKNAQIIDTGVGYLSTLALSFIPYSLSFSLISATRSVGKAKIGFYSSLFALVTKLFFNYVLMYGRLGFEPQGVRGASISTLIARTVEAIVTVIYVLFIEKKLFISLKDFFRIDRKSVGEFFKHTTPIFVSQAVWAFNTLSATAIMGMQRGEGVMAGLGIATTLNNLIYVPTNAVSMAFTITVGKCVGEKKNEKIVEYSHTGQLLFIIVGLTSALLLFLLSSPFVSLYKVGEQVKNIARSFLYVYVFVFPFTAYQMGTLTGLIRGGGTRDFTLRLDLFFVFLVVLPLALISIRLSLAPYITLLFLKCDHVLKCIPATVKLNRFDWLKNTTQG